MFYLVDKQDNLVREHSDRRALRKIRRKLPKFESMRITEGETFKKSLSNESKNEGETKVKAPKEKIKVSKKEVKKNLKKIKNDSASDEDELFKSDKKRKKVMKEGKKSKKTKKEEKNFPEKLHSK